MPSPMPSPANRPEPGLPAGLRLHRSAPASPWERGRAFGLAEAPRIAATLAAYRAMWDQRAGESHDPRAAGIEALAATRRFAPHLAEEMEGIAQGAGIEPALIGALNARTEILGRIAARHRHARIDGLKSRGREADQPDAEGSASKAPASGGTGDTGATPHQPHPGGPLTDRGECSAVIGLRPGAAPVAVQTWDWYHRFRDSWLIWEIALEDGSTTRTLTEYGIVGKAGLNTRGLGLLFTILHHQADGGPMGVPVHVVARAALDLAPTLYNAAEIAVSAPVSASSSLNFCGWDGRRGQAITVEMSPRGPGYVLPEANGLLVHTNHFLAPALAAGDTETAIYPDTLLRRDMLLRELAGGVADEGAALAALDSHLGGDSALCCHPAAGTDPADQYETLATLVLDMERGEIRAHPAGPCTFPGRGA